MSEHERKKLSKIENFPSLWLEMCFDESTKDLESQAFSLIQSKMKLLIDGYYLDDYLHLVSKLKEEWKEGKEGKEEKKKIKISWSQICSSRITHYEKPALEFPKGRRNKKEPSGSFNLPSSKDKSFNQQRTCGSFNLPQHNILSPSQRSNNVEKNGQRNSNEKNGHRSNSNEKIGQRSGETNIECAKREFEEETNIKPHQYKILNVKPLQEIFTGINGCRYVYVYYLAEMLTSSDEVKIDPKNKNQFNEVGEISWCDYETILTFLRPRDSSRIATFKMAHTIFQELTKNKNQLSF
jgi:8-oxo-dGTP pyrophosphatase MutT (NUDIX family)